MILRAQLGEETFDLDVHRDEEGSYVVEIGDSRFDVNLTEPNPGVFSLLVGNDSYEAVVRDAQDGLDVALAGRSYQVAVSDPAVVTRAAVGDGTAVVRSVMAGRVLQVLVAEGAKVQAGTPLLVVEAMKMENEIRSPRDGVVRSISVQPDQPVETGAELVIID